MPSKIRFPTLSAVVAAAVLLCVPACVYPVAGRSGPVPDAGNADLPAGSEPERLEIRPGEYGSLLRGSSAVCDPERLNGYLDASFRGIYARAAGVMAMAEVFSDPEVYRPENFGFHVTAENCGDYLDRLFSSPPQLPAREYTRDVPVLLYHHLEEDPADPANVSPESLEAQLKFLREHGYTAVSLREMADFVYRGGALPEKPVLLTFDDGYKSNYDLAFPLLRKYGMKAVIFPIGVSVGKTLYKDTNYPMTPHFGFDEAREMLASGLVEIGSHTWDMHQWPPFESGDRVRETVLPLKGESESDRLAALNADLRQYDRVVRRELGQEGFLALAYPSGKYDTLSEVAVHGFGIPITLTTRTDRRNILIRGLPQSLCALSRWYVADDTAPEELLAILEGDR